jgi:Rrf2 family transcriptional regulator, nitric oxide-sensitive transcriptional repressor
MKLTVQSDIALRILLYAGMQPDRPVSAAEISRAYGLSQHHVSKVAHLLSRTGYLTTRRGKTGGFLLGRPAAEIRVGDLIRLTEPDFDLLECFQAETDRCRISRACRLKGVLFEARDAFLAVLDRYNLADLLKTKPPLKDILIFSNR